MPEENKEVEQPTTLPKKYVSEFAPSQLVTEKPKQASAPITNNTPVTESVTPAVTPAPTPTPETLQKPPGEYASFGRRFVASLLDSIILAVLSGIITLPTSLIGGGLLFTSGVPELGGAIPLGSAGQTTSSIVTLVGQLVSFLVNIAYPLYFIGKKGQTPGKMALGIKVVKKDSREPPGYVGAFLREFVGKIISAIFLGLGYLWMIWDKEKQTWHDKIAGTVVVRVSK